MSKVLYHNCTKSCFNLDGEDLIDLYALGDVVMKSEYGDATLYSLDQEELKELLRRYVEEDPTEEEE